MNPRFADITLEGQHVRLEPLTMAHADELRIAASGPRDTFNYTWVPEPTVEDVTRYVHEAERQRDAGLGHTFATIRCVDHSVVGSTRYMNAEYWTTADRRTRDGVAPDALEIGSTWLSSTAQRSGVNTEAKLLMLDHAFGVLGVKRVTFKTDARNQRSRDNIERVGAVFEGVLRSHMAASDGGVRDSAMYSVLAAEWPTARARLAARLRPMIT